MTHVVSWYVRTNWWLKRNSKKLLLGSAIGVYELVVVILLLSSITPPEETGSGFLADFTRWDFLKPTTWATIIEGTKITNQTIFLLFLAVIPFLAPRISRLSLPFMGGSATVQFKKEVHERITDQDKRIMKISNNADMAINSLVAHLVAPPCPRDGDDDDKGAAEEKENVTESDEFTDRYRNYVNKRIAEQKAIVIGCNEFTESRLLCAMLAILIKDKTGFDATPKFNYGGPALNMSSLMLGQIDVYPSYTWVGFEMSIGPSLKYIVPSLQKLSSRKAITKLNEIYSKSPHPLVWLEPWGFENNWEMVMLKSKAEELNIGDNLSDLKLWGDRLRLGCEYEFFAREAGYGSLKFGYDIRFNDIKFCKQRHAYKLLAEGAVDIIDGFTTNPEIDNPIFHHLADDENAFGKYFAAPVVRKSLIDRYPEVGVAIASLKERFDEIKKEDNKWDIKKDMQNMIRDANLAEKDHIGAVKRVALKYLYDKKFISSKEV